MELVIIKDKDDMINDNVITGINLISHSQIFSDSNTTDCNFNFECIHKENEDIIFTIENCIEMYSCDLICSTPLPNNYVRNIWNYKGKINILNDTRYIPFNIAQIIFHMKINQSYCNPEIDYNIKSKYIESRNPDLYIDNYTIINHTSITYIWTIDLFQQEHVWKYMMIPTFLTIMQQIAHLVKNEGKADWIGIIATFILSDIALIFTLPETNTLIFSEIIIYINLFLKMILGLFSYYDFDIKIGDDLIPSLGHHKLDIIFVFCVAIGIFIIEIIMLWKSMIHKKYIELILKNGENKHKTTWDLMSFVKRNKESMNINYKFTIKDFYNYLFNRTEINVI